MVIKTPKALSVWYRSERRKKGLTQQDIAKRAALSQRDVSEFENCRVEIGVGKLIRLLNAAELNLEITDGQTGKGTWEW